MKKLALNIDDLSVESFSSAPDALSLRGTVRGRGGTCAVTCNYSCGGTCAGTCNEFTCENSCSCWATCAGYTCPQCIS